MEKEVVDLFKKAEFKTHPVWILIGDISRLEEVAAKMVDSVHDKVGYYDKMVLELNRTSLSKLTNFLSLNPLNIKIATCILKGQDEFVTASLLKTVEEVPENTVFIIIAQSVDTVLYSRGIVFKFRSGFAISEEKLSELDKYEGFEGFLDKLTEYDSMSDTINEWLERRMIQAMKSGDHQPIRVGYNVWKEFAEIRGWSESGQINKTQATEMMLSLLEMSQLLRPV